MAQRATSLGPKPSLFFFVFLGFYPFVFFVYFFVFCFCVLIFLGGRV